MKLPVERMIELEEKRHVAIQGATADWNPEDQCTQVRVRGELTAASRRLEKDTTIVATVYASTNEVIGVGYGYACATDFIGFTVFDILINCSLSHGNAVRVRLHAEN